MIKFFKYFFKWLSSKERYVLKKKNGFMHFLYLGHICNNEHARRVLYSYENGQEWENMFPRRERGNFRRWLNEEIWR